MAPDSLFQLFSYITGGDRRQKAVSRWPTAAIPDGDAAALDALASSAVVQGRKDLDPEAFIEALETGCEPAPLPISSFAPRLHPNAG